MFQRYSILTVFTVIFLRTIVASEASTCANLNQTLLSNLAKIGLTKSPWEKIKPNKLNIVISDDRSNLTYIYSSKANEIRNSIKDSIQCDGFPSVVVIKGNYLPTHGIGSKTHLISKIIDPELTYHVKMDDQLSQFKKKLNIKNPVENIAIDLALHEAFHLCTMASAGVEEIDHKKVSLSFFQDTIDHSDPTTFISSSQCDVKTSSYRKFLSEEFADLKNLQSILKKETISEDCLLTCPPKLTPQIDLITMANPLRYAAIKEIAQRITARRHRFKSDPLYNCLASIRDHERTEGSATYFSAEFGIFNEQELLNPLDANSEATFTDHTAYTYLTGFYLFKMASILAPDQSWQTQVQAGRPIDMVLKSIISP